MTQYCCKHKILTDFFWFCPTLCPIMQTRTEVIAPRTILSLYYIDPVTCVLFMSFFFLLVALLNLHISLHNLQHITSDKSPQAENCKLYSWYGGWNFLTLLIIQKLLLNLNLFQGRHFSGMVILISLDVWVLIYCPSTRSLPL